MWSFQLLILMWGVSVKEKTCIRNIPFLSNISEPYFLEKKRKFITNQNPIISGVFVKDKSCIKPFLKSPPKAKFYCKNLKFEMHQACSQDQSNYASWCKECVNKEICLFNKPFCRISKKCIFLLKMEFLNPIKPYHVTTTVIHPDLRSLSKEKNFNVEQAMLAKYTVSHKHAIFQKMTGKIITNLSCDQWNYSCWCE